MGYRVKGESLIRFTPFRPTATDPTGGIVLPPGKSTYNNEIEVFVRAKDGIGGLTLSEPMIIQVSKLLTLTIIDIYISHGI